jgi:hypothetical protein
MSRHVPAIHVFLLHLGQDVDAPDKPGHDVKFDGIPARGGFMSRKTVLPGGLSTQD